MKMGINVSRLGIGLECLLRIWEPAGLQGEARLGSPLTGRNALGRAGYEVSNVDLPESVSGFAEIIADRPHIVLNRAKSQEELQCTLLHELGHHILHLKPVRAYDPLGFPGTDEAELEADLFAAAWLFFLRNNRQRNAVLLRNPEISKILPMYLLLSVILIPCLLLICLIPDKK
jgi:hypothetical protein